MACGCVIDAHTAMAIRRDIDFATIWRAASSVAAGWTLFIDRISQTNQRYMTSLHSFGTYPRIRGFGFRRVAFHALFGALLDEAWSKSEERALYRILDRDYCIRFANPEEPITLLTALRLSQRLQVPLVTLLRGDLGGSSLSIFDVRDDEFPASVQVKPRRRLDLAHIQQAAEMYADCASSDCTPPSLKALGRLLSVSTRGFRYRCPSAADAIVSNHHKAEADRIRAIRRSVKRAVMSAIEKWTSTDTGLASRKWLLRVIRKAKNLPKRVLVAEIARQFSTSGMHRNEASS